MTHRFGDRRRPGRRTVEWNGVDVVTVGGMLFAGSTIPRVESLGLEALHGSTGSLLETVAKSVAVDIRMVSILPGRDSGSDGLSRPEPR